MPTSILIYVDCRMGGGPPSKKYGTYVNMYTCSTASDIASVWVRRNKLLRFPCDSSAGGNRGTRTSGKSRKGLFGKEESYARSRLLEMVMELTHCARTLCRP